MPEGRAGEDACPSSSREREFALPPSCSNQVLSLIRKGISGLGLLIQTLMFSGHTVPGTPRSDVLPAFRASLSSARLTQKMSHHDYWWSDFYQKKITKFKKKS